MVQHAWSKHASSCHCQVNYINAHATSTLVGDVAEVKAIKNVFSDVSHVKINGTKSLIGHCLGAAGGMEAIATVQAIRTGYVHPTLNQVQLPRKRKRLGVAWRSRRPSTRASNRCRILQYQDCDPRVAVGEACWHGLSAHPLFRSPADAAAPGVDVATAQRHMLQEAVAGAVLRK